MTRREWLAGAGSVMAFGLTGRDTAVAGPAGDGWKVSMCDWSMGRTDASAFELGSQIGLDGIQVSIGFPEDGLKLRRKEAQKQYLEAARKCGLSIPSVAMGVLNHVPLMSEPHAALWAADTIEAAKAVGARNILFAFFGKGELKEENEQDMRRVTEVMKELAPRAEKAEIILGLETYLSAEGHLKILDAVKSKWVQVYYDVYNANHEGHDYLKEIRQLGRERICEVHFKEGADYLGSGKIDWPGVAAALKEIGYRGWLVLETQSPSKDVVADTKRNLEYLRKLFA
ncbi:MAG: endonuclease [Phycisphaerae bacterium]